MRKKIGMGILVVLVLIVGTAGWITGRNKVRLQKIYDVPLPELGEPSADLALGERIARVRNGCVDCHGADLGGAVVINDPALAVVSGPNITPHALKDWSDAEIARAIRNGLHRSGRPLFVMPSKEYLGLSKDDLKALIAYLRSVPSVDRPNVPYELGPVGEVLMGLGVAQFIAAERIDHQATPFTDKPAEAITAAFGQYLASTACTGCHGDAYTGGPIAGGDPSWPPASDLTQRALAEWNEEDFIRAMKTGTSKNGQALRAPMPIQLTSQMSDLELKSLWMFFKTLSGPPVVQRAER